MDRAPCLGYGEVTCDDEINTDDVIALLRFSAGVSKNSICLPIGTTIVGDIISQGEATITGTYSADLDSGVFNQAQYENDLFWSQATETIRSLIGTNNARFASVNGRAYNAIDFPFLYGLLYTDDLIDGNDDATNELTNGSVCAVRTSGGNYAKVMVVAYGYNLTLDWVTYRPGK
jgi:hypothetical protein